MVRWSVGGDPRTPLLLTHEVSAGGQVVSRGRPPNPPVAHAGGLSGWSGGQSGETPEPPCCSRRDLFWWSVGGDPRAPLLLTHEISLGTASRGSSLPSVRGPRSLSAFPRWGAKVVQLTQPVIHGALPSNSTRRYGVLHFFLLFFSFLLL